MNPIRIGLLGAGVVASGVANVLNRNQAEIKRRAGRGIEIARIAATYHAWRGDAPLPGEEALPEYVDQPGFCKSATLEEIGAHGWVLTPGRYVGAEAVEEDSETFAEKMAELTKRLEEQMAEGARLDGVIKAQLALLGNVL